MLKQSASGHGLYRVKREICEKGATWTDWVLPHYLARLARPACLAYQHSFSADC